MSLVRDLLHHEITPRFLVYRPTMPQDPCRGRHRVREAMARLPVEASEQAAEEDEALLRGEAAILPRTIWDINSSSDSEDDDFALPPSPPDSEVGGSTSVAAMSSGRTS